MAQRTLVINQIAPVPVGHRVQVHSLQRRVDDGWFEGGRDVVLVDLDTGVEYVPARFFSSQWGSGAFGAHNLSETLDPQFARAGASWFGRVLACRVATDAELESGYATRLVLEVMEGAAPSR